MITFKQFYQQVLLIEDRQRTLVFCFGRYNPISRGHIEHFKVVEQFANDQDIPYMVFASHTVDKKKNPLPVNMKIELIKKAMPSINIMAALNMFDVVKKAGETKLYDKLVYFAGSDYFDNASEQDMFRRLKVEAEQFHMQLDVLPSGKRAVGISGTDLRTAAINNDFATFAKTTPIGIGSFNQNDAKAEFEAVRAALVKSA